MIRVVLVDDHALIRRGLRDSLTEAGDIRIVGEAGDYGELRQLLHDTEFDVLLLDINLPGRSGLDVLHSLAERGLLDGGLRIRTLTLPDIFQDHDTLERMYELAGLDARSIATSAIKALGRGDERALKLIVG